MKNSQIKSYDELPLLLNADLVAKTLGVASSTAYELMHEKDFPAVRIGNRFVVPKEEFQAWIKKKILNMKITSKSLPKLTLPNLLKR